jgi:hypothetical protein
VTPNPRLGEGGRPPPPAAGRWAVPVEIGPMSREIGYAVVRAASAREAEGIVRGARGEGRPIAPTLWLPPPQDRLDLGTHALEEGPENGDEGEAANEKSESD